MKTRYRSIYWLLSYLWQTVELKASQCIAGADCGIVGLFTAADMWQNELWPSDGHRLQHTPTDSLPVQQRSVYV